MADYAQSATPTIHSMPRGSTWATLLGIIGTFLVLAGSVGVQLVGYLEGAFRYVALVPDNFIPTAKALLELAIAVVIVVSIAKALRSQEPARVYGRGALAVLFLAAAQCILFVYQYISFFVLLEISWSLDLSVFLAYSPVPLTNFCFALAALLSARVVQSMIADGSLRRSQIIAQCCAVAALIFPTLTLLAYVEVFSVPRYGYETQTASYAAVYWFLLMAFAAVVAAAFGSVAVLRATKIRRVSAALDLADKGSSSGTHSAEANGEATLSSDTSGGIAPGRGIGDVSDEWASLPVVIPTSPRSQFKHQNERLSTPKQTTQTFVDLSRASVWVVAAGGAACVAAVAMAFSGYLIYGPYTFDDISVQYVISMLNLDGIGISIIIIALGIALRSVPKSVFDQNGSSR